ncbi:hypothetical protein FOL47_007812 [Perkinsus chesapeaki]|uniref:Uncharacterized protein n=1 Tax=Perkinsus chesapeaki TaxID=330153 RepID=A0A7J6LHQ3_PERCH|nr:hypothetical protein FOL47_007812 [Perkinsus chesapeaki]
MATFLQAILLSSLGASAFTMSNIHEHGKPVRCHISKSRETMGMVLPGMDDGKSFTIYQDVFIVNGGQVTVQASPNYPYQYLLMAETPETTETAQFFNKKSFPVYKASRRESKRPPMRRLKADHTLEDDTWVHHGIIEVDGQKVNKWVKAGVEGVDPQSGINSSSLIETGLLPNTWILMTDESDKKMVKLLGVNSFEDGKVFQETSVIYWEDLSEGMTIEEALSYVYSQYDIGDEAPQPASGDDAPTLHSHLVRTHLVGESTRKFFKDGKKPDWKPRRRLRSSAGSPVPIDYFGLDEGTASAKYFTANKRQRHLMNVIEFEFPTGCAAGLEVGEDTPYCLYVDIEDNKKTIAMVFVDVFDTDSRARLEVGTETVRKGNELSLNFIFRAGGCAVIFQQGLAFAKLDITVCVDGEFAYNRGSNTDPSIFEGSTEVKLTFRLVLPTSKEVYSTILANAGIYAVPGKNYTVYGELGIELGTDMGGVRVSFDVYGHSPGAGYDKWDFQSRFNLRLWVDVLSFQHEWPWTWTIWDARPETD